MSLINFSKEFESFQSQHAAIIRNLYIESQNNLHIYEIFDNEADELKSFLGARLAKEKNHPTSQEDAISLAETWVSENIMKAECEPRIAAVLWLRGLEEGEKIIRNALPTKNETATVRFTIDVTYNLKGENVVEMMKIVRKGIEEAMDNGLLTGESDADVESSVFSQQILNF